MKLHVYSSPRKTAHAVCRKLMEKMKEKEGTFHLAIPGGNTPIPFYNALAGKYRKDIPWERVCLYWVDEICVPPTHPASNYGLVKRLLLDRIPLSASQIFRIRGEADPEEEACRYSQLVKDQLPSKDGIPVFDMVIVGVGNDGHTSSVFPGEEPVLHCQENYAVAFQPETGQKRIALTGNPTLHARDISLYITGAEKAPIVKEILIDSNLVDDYAAKFILQEDNAHLDLFLDRSALSLTKDWQISTLIDADYPEHIPKSLYDASGNIQ